MFDYSAQVEAFHDGCVRLPSTLEEMLFAHRAANRDRLIARISAHIAGVGIGEANFRPQGSVAMKTVIQTRFEDEEYDIDDGVVIPRAQLVDAAGNELSASSVRGHVRDALGDGRFNRQPHLMTNCVRVFYADRDDAKHHVDIPIYREWTTPDGRVVRELASDRIPPFSAECDQLLVQLGNSWVITGLQLLAELPGPARPKELEQAPALLEHRVQVLRHAMRAMFETSCPPADPSLRW